MSLEQTALVSRQPSDIFANELEGLVAEAGLADRWKIDSWFAGGGIILPTATRRRDGLTVMFQDRSWDDEPFDASVERWGAASDSGDESDDWGGAGWALIPKVAIMADRKKELEFAMDLIRGIESSQWPFLEDRPVMEQAFGHKSPNKGRRIPKRRVIRVGHRQVEVSSY